MPPRSLAVVNLKGGQAKSTTSVVVGDLLASERERVLVVDLDPSSNPGATQYLLGHTAPDDGEGLYHVLGGNEELAAIARPALHVPGLFVAPAGRALAKAEHAYRDAPAAGQLFLRRAIERSDFDWVILDCPPTAMHFVNCALAAAERVLVPCTPESMAVKGLAALTRVVDDMRSLNRQLHIAGIVPTVVKLRRRATHEQMDRMRADYGDAVFEAYVRDDAPVTESESHARPVTRYRRASNGAADYRDVFQELMSRVGGL